MISTTKSAEETKKLGRKAAEKILKSKLGKEAKVFGLIGDLGGGKTTFLQGFAKGLGIREKILSPTFVIIKRFKIQDSSKDSRLSVGQARFRIRNFYHIDCYRIKKPKEVLDFGFKEIISNPQNIVAVEWADRVRSIMPPETVWIKFKFIDQKTRKIVLKYR